MNTKLFLLLVLTTFVISFTANAVLIPGLERPIAQAELIEFDDDGREINTHVDIKMTLLKRGGSLQPTSIRVTEKETLYCITTPCPARYDMEVYQIIRQPLAAGCGSVKYIAIGKTIDEYGNFVPIEGKRIELVDHTPRICEDYREFMWESTVYDYEEGYSRYLVGNPKSIVTIQ